MSVQGLHLVDTADDAVMSSTTPTPLMPPLEALPALCLALIKCERV